MAAGVKTRPYAAQCRELLRSTLLEDMAARRVVLGCSAAQLITRRTGCSLHTVYRMKMEGPFSSDVMVEMLVQLGYTVTISIDKGDAGLERKELAIKKVMKQTSFYK